MRHHRHEIGRPFVTADMVSASELREFLFCERAWFLSRKGLPVSSDAEAQRVAGTAFHETRAAAAGEGASPRWLKWALILATAGMAILLFQLWLAIK